MLLRAMVMLLFVATLALSDAETPNITLEQYFHLPADQQDKIVITIANEYAEYYDGTTAQLIRDLFNKKTPGALHTRGVNQIDGLSKEVAKKQDTHSVSLNTLIGKYLVAEYGPPPKVNAGTTTKNFTLEEYLQLPDAHKDATIIAIAFEDADFYGVEMAKRIKEEFSTKSPGAFHTKGVNHIVGLVNVTAAQQNIHSVSLNTLIGKYIIVEYGSPTPK